MSVMRDRVGGPLVGTRKADSLIETEKRGMEDGGFKCWGQGDRMMETRRKSDGGWSTE